MKKIIAGMIGAAVLGGAVVAQEVTFYNRMGSVLVEQAATKDADANFGKLYDRIVGQYDSEKFSFFGRFEAQIVGWNDSLPTHDTRGNKFKPWADFVGLALGLSGMPEFNGAMRPLPFLELALGNSYGAELPWEGYELPGAYGYGSDVSYGRRKWADGEGGTLLFKGAGIGVDGLYIGWNALPIQNPFKTPGSDGDGDGWDTQLGVIYNVDGLLGIGVGAKLTTRKREDITGKDIDPNQQIGVYAEYTGVENLKVGAGVTMDTNGTGGFITKNPDDSSYTSGDWGGNLDFLGFYNGLGQANLGGRVEYSERGFNAFVNAGAQYSFAGMGLPLTLGADVGLLATKKTIFVVEDGDDIAMMPMLVGAVVRVDPMENLWFDLRAVYEDALLSGVPDEYGDCNLSRLTITPRVHFLLSESDEFRLQVPITTKWTPERGTNGKYERSAYTGFNIGVFWQHNF